MKKDLSSLAGPPSLVHRRHQYHIYRIELMGGGGGGGVGPLGGGFPNSVGSRRGGTSLSSSLACFPAVGRLLVVLNGCWSRISGGEEARMDGCGWVDDWMDGWVDGG